MSNKLRYKFIENGNTIICLRPYRGETYKGIAKCNGSEDAFNSEFGKKLAQIRCDRKIALKRLRDARDEYVCLENLKKYIDEKYEQGYNYFSKAFDLYTELEQEEAELIEELTTSGNTDNQIHLF